MRLRTRLDYAEGLREKGYSLLKLEQNEEAKEVLKESIKFNPCDPETWRIYSKPDVANYLEEPRLNKFSDMHTDDSKLLSQRWRMFIQRILSFDKEQIDARARALPKLRVDESLDSISRRLHCERNLLTQRELIDLVSNVLNEVPGQHLLATQQIYWKKKRELEWN